MSNELSEIKKEYIKCKKSKSLALNTISVGKITDKEWIASFVGPKKTGYQGGLFKLIIKIPDNYPNSRPEVRFKYPVFHPNVDCYNDNNINPDGYHICSSYINNWTKDRTIEGALNSIYQLMIIPTPAKGYSNEATKLLNSLNGNCYHEEYKKKCNEWVRKYATINNK